MMRGNGYVDSSLSPYALSKEPIRVAHPMEMGGNDIRFWRKYLASNGMDAWQMSEPTGNYAWVYNVTSDDRIELSNIEIENPSRYANHVIATLDKIVVNEWVMEDNVSISDFLPEFTYPQIMEFVELAQDANSTNVLAILLDYLDKTQDDYG